MYFDRAAELCQEAGFTEILLRGDTDFSQTEYLDGWHEQGFGFVFGMDCMPNLRTLAEKTDSQNWKELLKTARRILLRPIVTTPWSQILLESSLLRPA